MADDEGYRKGPFYQNLSDGHIPWVPPPPDGAEWEKHIVAACKTGDISLIESEMKTHTDGIKFTDEFVTRLLCVLVHAEHAPAVTWMLERFPDWPNEDPRGGNELARVFDATFYTKDQPKIFKAIADSFPQICSWRFEHCGNVLGIAARENNLEFAKYLIHQGAVADKAYFSGDRALARLLYLSKVEREPGHMCYEPDAPDRAALIQLLRDHGAVHEQIRD